MASVEEWGWAAWLLAHPETASAVTNAAQARALIPGRYDAAPATVTSRVGKSAGGERGRRELVARAAARLVLFERAVDEPLGHGCRPAAAVTDGLQLVHELGAAQQLRHGGEREAAEVLVEPAR